MKNILIAVLFLAWAAVWMLWRSESERAQVAEAYVIHLSAQIAHKDSALQSCRNTIVAYQNMAEQNRRAAILAVMRAEIAEGAARIAHDELLAKE